MTSTPTSKKILFSIVENDRTSTQIIDIATQILLKLQSDTELPSPIKIFDLKGKPLSVRIDIASWTRDKTFAKRFTMYDKTIRKGRGKNESQKAFVVTYASETPFRKIRGAILEYLRENNVWMQQHHWNDDDVDYRPVGHLMGIEPGNMNSATASSLFFSRIQASKLPNDIPTFRIAQAPMFINITDENNKTQRTSASAFAVQVRSSDFRQASTLFKRFLQNEAGQYLDISSKRHPIQYKKSILVHKQRCSKLRSIPIRDLPPTFPTLLFDIIQEDLPHVIGIYASSETDPNRYNVLTTTDTFFEDRLHLWSNLPSYIADIQTDNTALVITTPPHVHTQYNEKPELDDDSNGSSVAQSVLSWSTLFGYNSQENPPASDDDNSRRTTTTILTTKTPPPPMQIDTSAFVSSAEHQALVLRFTTLEKMLVKATATIKKLRKKPRRKSNTDEPDDDASVETQKTNTSKRSASSQKEKQNSLKRSNIDQADV